MSQTSLALRLLSNMSCIFPQGRQNSVVLSIPCAKYHMSSKHDKKKKSLSRNFPQSNDQIPSVHWRRMHFLNFIKASEWVSWALQLRTDFTFLLF